MNHERKIQGLRTLRALDERLHVRLGTCEDELKLGSVPAPVTIQF